MLMNKFLRYSFVALMAMFMGNAFAEEVTVSFIPAETKATATATEVTKDGITLNVTAGTMNRDDNYRVNKGQTLTVTSKVGNIKKITFTSTVDDPSLNYGAKYDVVDGTFTAEGAKGTWTGDAAEVKLTATDHQVRATEYIVTVESNGNTPGIDTPDEPSDNPFEKYNISSGSITEKDGQVIVDFKGTNQNQEITGNMVFEFGENKLCTKCTVFVTFPTEELAQAAYNAAMGDDEPATIDGKTVSVILTKDVSMMSKILVKSMMKMLIDGEKSGLGTSLEDLMTPNQANVLGGILQKDAASDMDFYIKGKIAKIKYEFSAQYGTATFFISADGNNDYTFQCYSVYYLENKPWVEGNTQIKVGDEVIICGKIVNYQGNTPETVSKQAYIYSLNGVTKNEGGENPQPSDEVKKVTVADFNAAAESNDVWYQLTGIVKNLKDDDIYGNFDLEDETGSVYVYGVLSEKGGEKKKFQELAAAKGIKNGCKLTIIGTRGSYNGKIEVMNAYFVSVEPGSDNPEPQPSDEVKEVTVAKALEIISALENGKTTSEEYLVKGFVVGTPDFQRKADGSLYGNVNFTIADEKGGATTVTIFRAKNIDNVNFTEETISSLNEGDEVVVRGKLQKYVKNGEVTPEVTNCYLISVISGASGIQAVKTVKADNGFIYNLAGQRVDANYKGVVIKNGQKMIQK